MSEPMEQGLGIPQWTLADRLRKSLDHAGVSSADMAQYLEVHRNTISNWIYGHARPPASAVKLWAMRCGVDYRWLSAGELPRVDSNHQPAGWLTDSSTPPSTRELQDIGSLRKRIRYGALKETS